MVYYEWERESKVFAIYKVENDGDRCIGICCSIEEVMKKYPDAIDIYTLRLMEEID